MKKCILGLFLLLSFQTFAQSRFKVGETVQVLSFSGLNLRQTPDTKAAVLATAPYGSSVVVSEDKALPKAFSFDGINGFWIFVSYGGKKGYAFDGYLTRMPAPPLNNGQMKDYVEKKFTKTGAVRKESKPDPDNAERKLNVETQTLNNGAVWVTESNDFSETNTLKIKNITLEEGFLLARAIKQDFQKASLGQEWNRGGSGEWSALQKVQEKYFSELEFMMMRDAAGASTEIQCSYRHEAGHCWISVTRKAGGEVWVEHGCVAD